MEQGFQILQKQKQILSQKQLQSLSILAMDNVELDMFLQNEYLENPLLEHVEIMPENTAGTSSRNSDEKDPWNYRSEDEGLDLKTAIRDQIKIGSYNKETLDIMEYLIECLDDSGYFTMPLDEAARKCGTSQKQVARCLEELQQFEPVGIFSTSLQECLLKQLEKLNLENDELKQMIMYHLEDVADGNIGNISRKLHISTIQVRKYILIIETLNPRPASGFAGSKTEYIVPDIIVYRDENWRIELNDHWAGNYEISGYYLKMMSETGDPQLKEYFANKAKRAQLILQSVEQRRQTLLDMMDRIVKWQTPFFHGTGSLRPMTMTDLAESMGVHPSTISRAVKGKYVQYPRETILLKSLFSQEISKNRESTGTTAKEIQAIIQKMIQEEDKKKPYSDQKLKEMLEEKEISISRRAVAKYREILGIKGSLERKC